MGTSEGAVKEGLRVRAGQTGNKRSLALLPIGIPQMGDALRLAGGLHIKQMKELFQRADVHRSRSKPLATGCPRLSFDPCGWPIEDGIVCPLARKLPRGIGYRS